MIYSSVRKILPLEGKWEQLNNNEKYNYSNANTKDCCLQINCDYSHGFYIEICIALTTTYNITFDSRRLLSSRIHLALFYA